MADHALVSSDLIWETCRSNNAYLVKRSSGGGSQFSKDPMNLTNKHSRKGIVNYTAKQNYRADLRQEAVARASAIRQAAREKKDKPEKKARGAKAKAAAEKES
ncbi:hypothetical protein Q9189_002051 [Teloschistes chrysophthalmus]